MKTYFLITLLVFSASLNQLQANLIKTIQEKNGDVYILIRPKNGGTPQDSTGLMHYKRTDNYAPRRLPLSDDSRILAYEGLSVDKFGHVKLFRTNSRDNASLWTLLNEGQIHPDSPGCASALGKDTYNAIKSYQGKGTCGGGGQKANQASFDSVNFGWSYVINTNSGKEGWYCIYPPGSYGKAYATAAGGGAPQMINCRFDRTDAQAASWVADIDRHAKVINAMPALAADAAVFPPIRTVSDPRRHPNVPGGAPAKFQPWGEPAGFLAHGRGHFIVGRDQGTYNAKGEKRKGNVSPLLGWFWARNPLGFGAAKSNGRRIRDLKLSKSKLFMEEFISDADNDLLKNSTTAGFTFTAGKDFYLTSNCTDPSNYTGAGYLHCRPSPIDTAYAFAEEIENYNDCSDLCGQSDPNVSVANVVLNKGRAKFSSAGSNQDLQRAYIIKKYYPVSGSQNDTYGVFQINGASFDSYMDWKSDSLKYNHTSGILSETNGSGTLRQFGNNDFVIAYNFNGGQGGNGNARSIQTSKRIGPDGNEDFDFIYVSDLSPSHFNVSSSFWGTGGMVWWALEKGNNLELNYEQYNHFKGAKPLVKGTVNVANATPLVAFGADGDNFIYILHGGGGNSVETQSDIDRITTPRSFARIKELCQEGGRVVKGCDGPIPDSTGADFILDVEINRKAGLKLEKIAPLKGSKPVRIGTLPLQSQNNATCQASFKWPGPVPPGENDPGALVNPGWTCTGADDAAIQAIVDANLIEMAIINVANPPATGGNLVMDIVEPPGLPVSKLYTEDTPYEFNMENPPRFNGPLAQLSLSANGDTNIYGDVKLISNYDEAGINLIKETLASGAWTPGTPIPPGSDARKFYDDDNTEGKLLSSFIYQDLKTPTGAFPLLLNDSYGSQSAPKGGTVKTLRYRWRVKALTPPHSFKDYKTPACVGLLKSPNGSAMSNATSLTNIGLLHPNGNENLMNNEPGVLFDSCWQDFGTNNSNLDELDDITTGLTEVVNPPTLKFKFDDPGVYEVQLWVGGLRFYADNFTFLDNPGTINMVLDATNAKSTVRVGALVPKTGEEIKNVVIANNDLADNQETRAAIYNTADQMKSQLASDIDDLTGPSGRLPIFPVANYKKDKPLVVTYQNQHTPIVAEAEIQFFRLAELAHHELGEYKTADKLMEKHMGVGAWDYSYPGGGKIPFGNLIFEPVDKTSEHPANWSTRSAAGVPGLIATDDESLDERRGYDASGNYETGRGYTQVGGGSLINGVTGADAQFQAAHQGTLASDDAFPKNYMGATYNKDERNLLAHPEAFYTWWEIKYAWFLRYTTPNGDVVKEVLKTGNLAEIFLLNYMAQKSPSWSRLVNNLAPYNLVSEGNSKSDDTNPLMRYEGTKTNRTIKVRIPLFNRNALLKGGKNDEMNQAFKDLSGYGPTFNTLYDKVHPMKFNTPSEPTILEIGFQLFYPSMNWEGRDCDNNGQNCLYFDAVYWGTNSGKTGPANINDFTKTTLSFGKDDILIWPNMATQKAGISLITGSDTQATALGLNLANLQNINGRSRVPGGFSASPGSDDAEYIMPGGARDDFVDIAVLDMIAPKIRLAEPAGGTLTANTGGRTDQDIVIEVEDNNPYAVWPSYDLVGNHGLTGGSDDRLIAPAIVEASYEVGFDPRNIVGLGLKDGGTTPGKAYGLNLSFTSLQNTDLKIDLPAATNLPQYNLSRFDNLTSGKPIYDQNSGVPYNPLPLTNNEIDFYFPYLDASNGLAQNGVIWYQRIAFANALTADQPNYQNSWDRINQFGSDRHKIYPPLKSLIDLKDSGVRLQEPSQLHSGLSKWMLRFIPDINDEYPYNLPAGNTKGAIVEYVPSNSGSFDPAENYSSWDGSCLNGTLNPTEANHKDCKIITRWRIPRERLLAPVFMNSNDNVLNFYAKARDVRISEDWPDISAVNWTSISNDFMNGNFGNWPKYGFAKNWKRRMGAENYGVEDDRGVYPADLNGRVEHFYNNELQRRTTKLADITVQDNDIPNVHITLYEFKNQTQVEYAVISAQGNDPSLSEDSKKLIALRSKDKRDQIPQFQSDAFMVQADDKTVVNINSIQPGMNEVNQAYHIPEDVRFMIQIEASDNKDLDEIEIEAKSLSTWNAVFTPPTGYEHVSSNPSNQPFNTIVTTAGRIYNQSKIARGYHMYPNSGTFDVIQVHVKDANNNERFINIPIVVVSQDVHFRSLGSQNKAR